MTLTAVLSFFFSSPVRAADRIFAFEWDVSKGLHYIVFPEAPPRPATGLVILRVEIDIEGSIAYVKTHSDQHNLSSVVAPAVKKWQYNSFVNSGKKIEVASYVSVLYDHSENFYYIQGGNCVFVGRPGQSSRVQDIARMEEPTDKPARIDLGLSREIFAKAMTPGAVIQGKAVHREEPKYPDYAKQQRISGTVIVRLMVNKSGRVVYAEPIEGPAVLQDVSVDAARKWTFNPTTVAGNPVRVIGTVTFNYRL